MKPRRGSVSSLAFENTREPARWLQLELQRSFSRAILDVAMTDRRALGTDAPLAALLEDVDRLPPRELEELLDYCGYYVRRQGAA